MTLWRLHLALLLMAATPVAAAPAPVRPLLMIALDAVPYDVVAELTDPARGEEALFRGFAPPAVLISSFPSTTSVAMGGILGPLGLERSPGYEARFFDWSERRVRGGGVVSYFRIPFPWRDFFDFRKKGPVGSAVAALHPLRTSVERLEKGVADFARSGLDRYLLYIGSTDTAAHLRSPSSLAIVLIELDAILERARQRAERPFDVVIFSDHGIDGGEPLVNVWRRVRQHLRAADFRYSKRLRRPGDVALTPFGLVSSFELYVGEGREAEVARLVAEVPGVELCVRRDGAGFVVENASGSARLERRERQFVEWRYQGDAGDPLGYRPLVREFAVAGGWQSDERWFEATREERYPDALYRIASSFDLIANPASVLCSVAEGHMFGARKTELGARLQGRLRWTHGALGRAASEGFLLTDVAGWEPRAAVRFDRALAPFTAESLTAMRERRGAAPITAESR